MSSSTTQDGTQQDTDQQPPETNPPAPPAPDGGQQPQQVVLPATKAELDKLLADYAAQVNKTLYDELTALKARQLQSPTGEKLDQGNKPDDPQDTTSPQDKATAEDKGDDQADGEEQKPEGETEGQGEPKVLRGEALATAKYEALLDAGLDREALKLLTATTAEGIAEQAAYLVKLKGSAQAETPQQQPQAPRMVVPGAGSEPHPPTIAEQVASAAKTGDLNRATDLKAAQLLNTPVEQRS